MFAEDKILNFDNNPLTYNHTIGLDNDLMYVFTRYSIYRFLLNDRTIKRTQNKIQLRNINRFRKFVLNVRFYLKVFLYVNYPKKLYGVNIANSSTFIKNGCYYESRVSSFIKHVYKDDIFDCIRLDINSLNRRFRNKNFFLNKLLFFSSVKAKFNIISDKEKNSIDNYLIFLSKELDLPIDHSFLSEVKNELILLSKLIPSFKSSFNNLLNKIDPKFLILEDANYGAGICALITKYANLRSIKTIEIQHGNLDIAFKYSDLFINNINSSIYKTKFFLTYGIYWSKYTHYPGKCIDIGYPFIEDKAKKLKERKQHSSKKMISFWGQGVQTKDLRTICIELARMFETNKINMHIVYKPHPTEYWNLDVFDRIIENNLFTLAENTSDSYELLNNSSIVIGSYSTILYEALFFSKRVLIHKNNLSEEYMPMEFSERFSDTSDLYDLILNKTFKDNNPESIKFWTKNSLSIFKDFARSYLND